MMNSQPLRSWTPNQRCIRAGHASATMTTPKATANTPSSAMNARLAPALTDASTNSTPNPISTTREQWRVIEAPHLAVR